MSIAWTDERKETLRRLRDEGMSLNQIGRALGVTRCAAVGMLRRMGLTNPKNNPILRVPANKDHPPIKRARPSGISLEDWKPSTCSWPIGDPKTPSFSFCGASLSPGHPYCADHCAVAYTTWGKKAEDDQESLADDETSDDDDGLRPIGEIAREVVERVRPR